MASKKKKKIISKNTSSIVKSVSTTKSVVVEHILEEDYPIFCFKYLQKVSIKECNDHKVFYDFLIRLQKLSELGWKEIRTSQRHSFGMESIPTHQILPQIPTCITPEVKALHAFRSNGNNLPFIGIQIGHIFRILFIETKFGHIYPHKN